MADAIAAGRDIRQFDAERLLDDVIDRARDKFWKPAGAAAKEEWLLALATMTRGLPVGALEGMTEKLLPAWDIDRHPVASLAMAGREPGERLRLWSQTSSASILRYPASRKTISPMMTEPDFARSLGVSIPFRMAQFMLLAHRDLPDHAMLPWLRKSPPSEGPSHLAWAMA